jgi:hypothetical protein
MLPIAVMKEYAGLVSCYSLCSAFAEAHLAGSFWESDLALRQCEIAMNLSPRVFPRRLVESPARKRTSAQAYFLTALSMAPPALARSSGIMTG